ncbi:MAG: multiheme c-type cytochrome [Planctomycetota bacterium]|nr:multiheme c-type cytochrome [Planctomycetota bacterium]
MRACACSRIGLSTVIIMGISFLGCSGPRDDESQIPSGSSPPVAYPTSDKDNEATGGTTAAATGTTHVDHQNSPPAESASGKVAPDFGPYCDGWEKPAAVIAATGQMHGYFEPCGCSDPQYGGVSRRAELLRQIESRDWPVIPVELGGTLKRVRQQSQFKFQTLLSAVREMNYRALALGTEELQLGAGWLLSQHVPHDTDSNLTLSFLAANVVLFQDPGLGTPVPHRVVHVGDLKVGLTAIYDPLLLDGSVVLDAETVQVIDPVEPLKKAIAALQQQSVDLIVLLSHARLSTSQKLAEQFPEIPLILSTGPIEEPLTDNPLKIGNTTLAVVGHKGKHVGLVGWYPTSTGEKFRFDLVKLDEKRFKDDPRMIEHMKYYQDMLRDSKLAETEPALQHPGGAKYVGAEKCGECHTKAFAKWSETGHANAFESIRKGRRGISRIFDPECLSCHVTGWHPQQVLRYESGYLNEKLSAHLLGNQCENCHGPGSKHVELVNAGNLAEARKLVKVTLNQAQTFCYDCHDLDNSPHFDFESYWPEVAHPGLD